MEGGKVFWGVGVVIILVVIFVVGFGGDENLDDSVPVEKFSDIPSIPSPPADVNYEAYNIDYMNDNVKSILVKKMGASERTAFYLPSTGYVNVSRGTKYGVAFVIQNVNPTIPEGNEFAYNFNADPASAVGCGVSEGEVQSWIERGWKSSGMIGGQWREDWDEWYDAMTIYFAFPSDVSPCNVKYDFVIMKDGVLYDSRTLEFNLV